MPARSRPRSALPAVQRGNSAPGEIVFDVGETNAPAWLVLEGTIDVVRRDGLHRESSITTHHPGQISGELSQLSGRQSLASGRAGPEGCTALPFDAAHIRALMIGSAEIGEILMRAYILRRVGLIEEGGVGSVLVGTPGTPDLLRLENFLRRNGYPYQVLDAANDEDGRAVVDTIRRAAARASHHALSEWDIAEEPDGCRGRRVSRYDSGD